MNESWRVGQVEDRAVYYEERHGDGWRRIELEAEPTSGARHVVYIGTIAQWESEPAWVQGRRTEIIKRLQTVLRLRDYEYVGDPLLDDDDASTPEAAALSDEECGWFGCRERALKHRILCARHTFFDGG